MSAVKTVSRAARETQQTTEAPVRVFVAATDAQMLAVKVLEYSIRKHTSAAVQLLPLHRAGVPIPAPSDPQNWPRTPFSFQRFIIPQLCEWNGRAIYLDSDMQVFQDIRELWNAPMDGADLLIVREPGETGRRPQYSVMLMDCAALAWDIQEIVAGMDAGRFGYEDLMYRMVIATRVRATLDPTWNSLERYEEGKTALVHYTDMETQPWLSRANPLGWIWCADLLEALANGVVTMEELQAHVNAGWIRPSLVYQAEHGIVDPADVPARAAAEDLRFKPPHEALPYRLHARGRVLRRFLQAARRLPGARALERAVKSRLHQAAR